MLKKCKVVITYPVCKYTIGMNSSRVTKNTNMLKNAVVVRKFRYNTKTSQIFTK